VARAETVRGKIFGGERSPEFGRAAVKIALKSAFSTRSHDWIYCASSTRGSVLNPRCAQVNAAPSSAISSSAAYALSPNRFPNCRSPRFCGRPMRVFVGDGGIVADRFPERGERRHLDMIRRGRIERLIYCRCGRPLRGTVTCGCDTIDGTAFRCRKRQSCFPPPDLGIRQPKRACSPRFIRTYAVWLTVA
jgi:hypothetical protein